MDTFVFRSYAKIESKQKVLLFVYHGAPFRNQRSVAYEFGHRNTIVIVAAIIVIVVVVVIEAVVVSAIRTLF